MVYLFGCSHTVALYTNFLNKKIKCSNRAINGNSNQKIINDVYNFINSDRFNKDKDVIVIQYTYTNRWWRPNVLPHNHLSFHSLNNDAPIFNEPLNNPFRKKLHSFYETFLTFFWDYNSSLRSHFMDIDLLKAYLEYNKINYIHYTFASGGNSDEWKSSSIEKINKGEYNSNYFTKLNLLNFENFYFVEDWAKKYNYLDNTNHIYPSYQHLLGKFILTELNNKFKHLKLEKPIF